jgi:hypothetical protein
MEKGLGVSRMGMIGAMWVLGDAWRMTLHLGLKSSAVMTLELPGTEARLVEAAAGGKGRTFARAQAAAAVAAAASSASAEVSAASHIRLPRAPLCSRCPPQGGPARGLVVTAAGRVEGWRRWRRRGTKVRSVAGSASAVVVAGPLGLVTT